MCTTNHIVSRTYCYLYILSFKLVPRESLPTMQKPTEKLPHQFRVILQNSYRCTVLLASLCFVNDSTFLALYVVLNSWECSFPYVSCSLSVCVCACSCMCMPAQCACAFVCVCMCVYTHISILMYVCNRCPKYSGQSNCAAVARCTSQKQTCCSWQSNSPLFITQGKCMAHLCLCSSCCFSSALV